MKPIRYLLACALLTATVVVMGCATKPKPFDYQPVTEMQQEPGIFTGEKGEWVVYSSDSAAAREKEASVSEPRKPGAELTPAEHEEFLRFQQWQKEKRDFEQFQQWKRSPEGSKEYEEFLEWKRWQTFQKWQESQTKAK
jgi:hypothetical protein